MLTSFFGKSNPINYLILAVVIFIGYFVAVFISGKNDFTLLSWVENIGFAIISVFLMLLMDFIIRKNHLTKNNTYGILLFSCFLLAIPIVFLSKQVLLATMFLLFALRRILSLRTDKNIEKKILDASIWITCASFFFFWSLLFFILVYFAIIQRRDIKYKQLLIPLVGFGIMFILAISYYLLVSDSFGWLIDWRLPISSDFSAYSQMSILLPITVIIALLIWSVIVRLTNLSTLPKKDKPNVILLLFSIALSLIVVLASPQKTGAEALFVFGPLVIIIANYIEIKKEFWFKEILLWLVVLLPLIVYIL